MNIYNSFAIVHPSQTKAELDQLPVNQTIGAMLASKKIAIFIQSLTIGGAERATLNLIKGLVQQDIHVDLLLANYSGGFLSEVPLEVRIIDLKGKRVLFSLFPLVRYIRAQHPDTLLAIQTHASLIALWAAVLAGVHTPLIVSQHTTLSAVKATSPFSRNRLIISLARLFFGYAAAAICVSQGVADDFIKIVGMPHEKTHVIYNPVVSAGIEQQAHTPISHPWFTHGAFPVILAVGRLTKAKDYPTLLRAFSLVFKKQPAHLIILGEGRERTLLEALIEQLGLEDNVQMPGFVANPYAYMAHARLLVLSSKWEGFGNVLVEAMACGTPVVSTDCRSGPGEILEHGRFGRLVQVGDAQALADAILETLQAPPDQALLRRRAQDFTLDESVRKYIRVFETCLLSNDE
jgi:glycosyltransferase involved in cell wall biosynthesis